jgi:hypothetical protein
MHKDLWYSTRETKKDSCDSGAQYQLMALIEQEGKVQRVYRAWRHIKKQGWVVSADETISHAERMTTALASSCALLYERLQSGGGRFVKKEPTTMVIITTNLRQPRLETASYFAFNESSATDNPVLSTFADEDE